MSAPARVHWPRIGAHSRASRWSLSASVLLPALVLQAGNVIAADPVQPSFAPGLLQAVLGLALVLALIWVAGWLMKKLAPGGLASSGLVRTIAATAVGQRERVVVVEVQDTWLVLGVAPGRVNTLHVLPKGELPAAARLACERTPRM